MSAEPRMELYHRYRPQALEDVVGQLEAVKVLRGFGKNVPHALLFNGPSGCGKTTMARIVSRMLGVDPDKNKFDYKEVNCGMVESALATIRDIHSSMSVGGISGGNRVYVLDEVQSFSRAKFAQEAALKMLEDGAGHAYFMLCTTDPKKIIATIRNRCSLITVKALSNKDVATLVRRVAAGEKATVSDAVVDKIVEVAAGSARSALVNLEKVLGIVDEQDQLASITTFEDSPAAFDLVKALIPWGSGSPDWKTVARLLEELKEQDPEGLRCMILASARAQLLKTGNQLAYKAISCLSDPLYDRGTGPALLAAGCYKICFGGK